MALGSDAKINRYDAYTILLELRKEISGDKIATPLLIVFSFICVFLLFPLAFLIMLSMVAHADLPVFDHRFVFLLIESDFLLAPFTLILVFYFYATNEKIPDINSYSYKRAEFFLLLCIATTLLPVIFHGYIFVVTVIYILFFTTTMFYLSNAYMDIDSERIYSQKSESNQNLGYDDFGIHGGLIDNPFSASDDINRAKLAVMTSAFSFSLVGMFIGVMFDALLYYIAISRQKNIKECAYFLDAMFENNMQRPNMSIGKHAKIILAYKGYMVLVLNEFLPTQKAEMLAYKAFKTG